VHLPKPGPATAEPGIWRHGALGGVVAECKGDNPEHHQDGSGYYHQMRKFHWAPHFFFFNPSSTDSDRTAGEGGRGYRCPEVEPPRGRMSVSRSDAGRYRRFVQGERIPPDWKPAMKEAAN
jgi:hypothetical protein